MLRSAFFPLVVLGACVAGGADPAAPPQDVVNCYLPVEGGWRIRIAGGPAAPGPTPALALGQVVDDARTHRRPLYPPADRTLVWTSQELAQRQRTPFRPMVLAANEPRFVVDLDSAGGLSGHLLLGLSADGGPSKWFHQFRDLQVAYVEGCLEYTVGDPAFPGVVVRLWVMPLADSVGLVMKLRIEGASRPGELVWAFGGASGFTTNYNHDAPQYKFSAEQCAGNVIRWENARFALLRERVAVMRGGSSWPGAVGFGDPRKVLDSPAALAASAQWRPAAAAAQEPDRIAVNRMRLRQPFLEGWVVIGRGGKIESFLADPPAAEQLARARNRSIVQRVVVRTPDPYLNQAMPMMALATEGIWGDAAMVHGGWSWRQSYLGWRIWYGPLCYGWTDRVKRSIQQHSTLGLVRAGPDQGALGHMLEQPGSVFYNMNEVFFDHVRQYFDYTGDVELMRRLFPVLKGIVAWEDRRLKPDDTPLYESSLDTWISDSHWYIRGQCTTASAYMLGAHRFLAELAQTLGEDPSPYRQKAESIRRAMRRKLWQPRQGVFAEYVDTLGARQLHPQPELATIYHSAEFGAAGPLGIYQMLDWVDHNLRSQSTPGGGRAYWSSNWFPNAGRSYTHSTYELAYAEELNLALTNYLAGRTEQAYAILRSVIPGIYNGPTPGGLSCHMCVDGRQRMNNEFADAISMWGRTVVEGLFGIRPKRHRGVVELSPQFPGAWREASIAAPHFAYRWRRDPRQISVQWQSPVATAVHLKLPLRARQVDAVLADGKPISYRVDPGVGLCWLSAKAPCGLRGRISISYLPAEIVAAPPIVWKEGDSGELKLPDRAAPGFLDPQGVLRDARIEGRVLRGTVAGEAGPRLLLLKSGTEACPFWSPQTVRIEPKPPAARRLWSPPAVKKGDLAAWTLVDLGSTFNASLPEVLKRVAQAAPPPAPPALGVNHAYWLDHITNRMAPDSPSDAAWRRKIGPDQVGWTYDGLPFKSPRQGRNIAVVTRAGAFPSALEVPVRAGGKQLYLMLSGMTFPCQSHVVNVRVRLEYADGTRQRADLVSPFDVGDCWGTWLWRFHDTAANGFENLGGRYGPPGSAAAGDLTQPIAVDTEAHLVKIPLRPNAELRVLGFEAVANDVIFGLMGASILK
jgi:hypothetical protein